MIKKKEPKAIHMLNWVKDRLFDCDLRISQRGVPYLLISRENITYSISYFGKSKKFRIFYPFRSDKQKKFDIKLRQEVVSFFKPKGGDNR